MPNEIGQIEKEVQRGREQADAAREAERRVQSAQDVPQYRYSTDGSYQRHFSDRSGRDITLRVEGNDQRVNDKIDNATDYTSRQDVRIRAYDTAEATSPPAFARKGEIGYANAAVEVQRDGYGQETDRRLKLCDIWTHDQQRGRGIGGQMLTEVERVGRERGAREIYGDLSYKAEDEGAVRHMYRSHGFEFRPKPGGGEEVFKALNRPETDATSLRREARRMS